MGIAELMSEIRKLPDDDLLALAAQVDADAARAVDERFSSKVREGVFNELAAEALKELKEKTTIPLHEVLDEPIAPAGLLGLLSSRALSVPAVIRAGNIRNGTARAIGRPVN